MRRRFLRPVWGVAVLLLLLLGVMAEASQLTILHVNDTHGHAWPFDVSDGPSVGGFAPLSTLVDRIRREVESKGGHVILLHAGDFNTGVPESDQSDAMPDIVAMNMIRFDAATLGNHEFDKPREVLKRQLDFARFPVVNANLVDSMGFNPLKPYVVKDFGDVSVAIYGLLTPETAQLEPVHLKGWTLEDPVGVSRRLVPRLKNRARVVIALTHLGWSDDPSLPGTSRALAEARIPGLDVIVDGHSHTLFKEAPTIGHTTVVQAGDWGRYLGRLDLTIEDGRITRRSWRAIPVNLKRAVGPGGGKRVFEFLEGEIPSDPKVEAALDYFKRVGRERLDAVVGRTRVLLDGERERVRSMDTNLTNLVADAMRWKVGADVALLNGGAVRASISPGDVTYRDVLTVLPFGSTLYVVELTGEQLKRVLDFAVTVPAGKGGWPHFSNLTLRRGASGAQDVRVGGKPLDMGARYRLVTFNYLALGGDGYQVLKELKGYDTGFVDAAVLAEFMGTQGEISGWDGSQRYVP
ncbi:5'-Nucleotidase domain protein [Thermanaerovibrio acidaminovorans DSM 6589]|uniref:5'-Nucleotidase domain protein n=1 Tax=Thermanaerovibrio acidaminovorans (strain ATCC 49978 / DSM 6589 / Su883) TaxID=525903 RepID=D1B8S4_THEAS|nr:bifunctional UDP-sugar hydrolase/5'-nucleotidase [Thermanaerovibrio acidaminovorans]ACZ18677.1 5'-Nucleotidase domain protein [Thermanaerovibrio acidaminovorans DSM 6589]